MNIAVESGKATSEFEKRISTRFLRDHFDHFSSTHDDKSELTVITVHIERAVIEYAEAFKNFAINEISEKNHDVIFDLSKTMFLDSAFLGSLVYLFKKISFMGSNTGIVIKLEKVKIFSHLKYLDRFLNIYPSLEEAYEDMHKLTNI